MNEVNEPDGDYDPFGTELQSLRFMVGDLDARLAALESARAEPPARTWPAPDCAADGEALPVVMCERCGFLPATRIMLLSTGGGMNLLAATLECGDEYLTPGATYITGEAARRILRDIAREAARIRAQGGAG